MAASVFLYHVVGDLTVGKPVMVEFSETETVEAAIRVIGESTEGGIPIWKLRSQSHKVENAEMRQHRFIGILNPLDIVAFLATESSLEDQENALKTPVSQLVIPNNSLLKEVDPGTRLIDALEMMKHGVRRLLVPKSVGWKGMSKRFSILYNGKWLKNLDPITTTTPSSSSNSINFTSTATTTITTSPSSSTTTSERDKFCCLSREDMIRFLIGCLGALAPLPLSSISTIGAINLNYHSINASLPAIEAARILPQDPSAVAVVEPTSTPDGQQKKKIIGEISATKLWKCDHLAAAWALANLSAGQFVMGVEDNMTTSSSSSLADFTANEGPNQGDNTSNSLANGMKPRKFSSRSIGFFSNPSAQSFGFGRSIYRGRSAPLTCKVSSSLAAVMAQMLSHRATHVWVTEVDNEDCLVGVIGYADILGAVTRQPAPAASTSTSTSTPTPTSSISVSVTVGATTTIPENDSA